MHRNTYLLVAILAVIAALILGVNIGRNTVSTPPFAEPSATPQSETPTPTGITLLRYMNAECGFSLQYPATYSITENEDGATLNDQNDITKIIYIACQEEIPRVPLTPDRIETIQIGTVSAELYHDSSEKDGTPIDKLIFTHPSGNVDIYIAGFGEAYNNIIQTITVNP